MSQKTRLADEFDRKEKQAVLELKMCVRPHTRPPCL